MSTKAVAIPDRLVIKVCHGCGHPVHGDGHHAHGDRLSPHREEEVVSQRAHEQEIEDATSRAVQIYIRSTSEASASMPDYIEGGGMDQTVPGGRGERALIISEYARDLGVDFASISCTRRWMRVDFAAIADRSAEAASRPEDYGEKPVAYTWQDDGWAWEDCEKNDPGAVGFYHLEEKPVPIDLDTAEGQGRR